MQNLNYPTESDSQEIGRMAEKAFNANSPIAWILSPTGGGADFGIDYIIELKNRNKQVFGTFYLQLKGTKSPSLVGDGAEISMQFDASTLNFYRNNEPALMVAVVDLSVSDSPKNCPIYYKWLDEEFLDSISSKREKNDHVSIRVSTSNQITEDLDVNPLHLTRLAIRETLIDFKRAVEAHSSTPAIDIEHITNTIRERPIFLAAAKDDAGAPWINNPESHVAGKLKKLSDAIHMNQLNETITLIADIQRIDNLTLHETAEFLTLKGTQSSLQGNEEKAHSLHKQAFELFPESRYKANYFESEFCLENLPSNERLEYVITQINDSNFRASVLKAKCLSILGREKDALMTLDKFPSEKTIIAKLMVYTISQNSDSFDQFAKAVDISSLNTIRKMMFHALVGRKLFFEGTNYEISDIHTVPIPSKGKLSYDFNKLKEAYDHIREGLKYAKEQNYPHDIFLLADIAVPLYSFFNNEKELAAYLKNIMDFRSESLSIIRHLIVLNFNIKNYREVIKLANQLKEKNIEDLSVLIVSTYYEQDKAEVMRLVDENLPILLGKSTQNIASIFCMAAQCAYDTLDETKEADYLEVVQSLNFKDLICIYQFVKSCNAKPQDRNQNYTKLYEEYLSLGRPVSIAYQLIPGLNVQDLTEAEWICDLAGSILKTRELYPEEATNYAFALIMRELWPDLEQLCLRVEQHGNSSNLWALFKAVAVESQGRSGEALEILDSGLNNDKRSLERAENYVNLCVRLGLFDKAEEKLTQLLEKSPSEKQCVILELLIFIYSSELSKSEKLYRALSRYGLLVNQNDEYQEGKYLCAYMWHTNRTDFDHQNIEEFRARLAKYTTQFPNSTVIRFGNLEEKDGTLNLGELYRIAGITEEKRMMWNKNRNLLRSQKMTVPYAMRPLLLDNVGDIFALWTYGKNTDRRLCEYRLSHSISKNISETEEIDPSKKIIIDETSLIILYELDLLDIFLSHFSTIVINKSSYQLFSRLSHATMGSIFSSIPKSIIDTLKRYISKLVISGSVDQKIHLVTQYIELLKRYNNPILLCDDGFLAGFLTHDRPGPNVINTMDLIDYFAKNSLIAVNRRSFLIEKICSLPIINQTLTIRDVTESLLSYLENRILAALILVSSICSIRSFTSVEMINQH